MEVKVNVELHGEPAEVGMLLAQLGEVLLGDELEEDEEAANSSWWTPERALAFVRGLTDPALQALGIVADNAPRVSFRDLQRQMGMTGVQLAGRLSSIGFAVARQGSPFPFVRDYYQRAYYMDEDVARLMQDAIKAEAERRRDRDPARLASGRLP